MNIKELELYETLQLTPLLSVTRIEQGLLYSNHAGVAFVADREDYCAKVPKIDINTKIKTSSKEK